MSCKNKKVSCGCTPVSPCDLPKQYCCLCYSHQWYNSPKYSECSRRIKVNDITDAGCGCTASTVAQDNFSFSSCGCNNEENNDFSDLDELYWQ